MGPYFGVEFVLSDYTISYERVKERCVAYSAAETLREFTSGIVNGRVRGQLEAVDHLVQLQVALNELGKLDFVARLAGNQHRRMLINLVHFVIVCIWVQSKEETSINTKSKTRIISNNNKTVRTVLHHNNAVSLVGVRREEHEVFADYADNTLHFNLGCRVSSSSKI